MQLCKLFLIQEGLDREIAREHKLENKDLLPEKLLALRVELGELANATRCFKFWSYKRPEEAKRVLEEFVDCIHFTLSIMKDIGFPVEKYDFKEYIQDKDSIVEQFNGCFSIISSLEDSDFEEKTMVYFTENLFGLGKMLGFDFIEISEAYLEKNKINHERLVSGY